LKPIIKPFSNPLRQLMKNTLRIGLAIATLGTSEIYGFQEDVINFVGNVGNAALRAMREATRAIFTRDFDRLKEAIKGAIPIIVAVGATILSGGSAAPAAIILLDAAYNASGLFTRTLEVLGNLENTLFGTDFIDTHTDEIVMLGTIAAAAYCGSIVGAEIFTGAMDLLNLSENVRNTIELVQGANSLFQGGKNLYHAYQNQKRYKDEYEEYAKKLQELQMQRLAAKEQFEELLSNADKWDYFAGGERFHESFAGNTSFNAGNVPYIGIFRD
ncbi:MAG: hypothetical protein K2O85_00555, partial [Helicobacter sp.]|nr:hypothetical protein [Helicobacter sp.]